MNFLPKHAGLKCQSSEPKHVPGIHIPRKPFGLNAERVFYCCSTYGMRSTKTVDPVQLPHPGGSTWTSVSNYLSPMWISECYLVYSVYIECMGIQPTESIGKLSHSKHVNTRVLLRILTVMGLVNLSHSTRALLHHLQTRARTHTHFVNVRTGGDFSVWVTFGCVSACLWVQLGPSDCPWPIKPVCVTRLHCCIPLVQYLLICGLSELCGIQERSQAQMLLWRVFERAICLAAWVIVWRSGMMRRGWRSGVHRPALGSTSVSHGDIRTQQVWVPTTAATSDWSVSVDDVVMYSELTFHFFRIQLC